MSYPSYWYAYINGQVQGPFTADQVAAMVRAGTVRPDTPLCGDGRTYVPAGQAMPQLFAAPAPVPPPPRPAPPMAPPRPTPPMAPLPSYQAPPQRPSYQQPPMAGPQAPPMAPYGAPPMGPPMMMPRPAGGRGGKVVLFVALAAVAVAGGVAAFLFLAGGGGASPASLAAELPAGDEFEFVDVDAMRELGDEVPPRYYKCVSLNPFGKQGVVATVETDGGRVVAQCPADQSELMKLLRQKAHESSQDLAGGARLWFSGGATGESLGMREGRIYSGPEATVRDMLLGRFPADKTVAGSQGFRELLARVSSSPVSVEIRKGRGTDLAGAKPSWVAEEVSVTSSRLRKRCLALFDRVEDARQAVEALRKEKQDTEASMKSRTTNPFAFRNVQFEALDCEQRGAMVIVTFTFRRTGGGERTPGK